MRATFHTRSSVRRVRGRLTHEVPSKVLRRRQRGNFSSAGISVVEMSTASNDVATPPPVRTAVHHRDVEADDFLSAYAEISGLVSLQASYKSGIAAARTLLPNVAFSALVSPGDLNGDRSLFETAVRTAIASGASDFAVWNVDANTSIARIREALRVLGDAAATCGREIVATAMPLCWEELEWAHKRYQTSD